MTIDVRNLAWLRSLKIDGHPDAGAKLHELISDLVKATGNIEQQTNSNASGEPITPAPIQGLHVTAQNGHFQIAIQDQSKVYRGIRYYVEHASNPQFTDAHTICLQDSRNHGIFLGNTTRFFRAYSAYSPSSRSTPVYHGWVTPVAVSGGGSIGGPAFLPSQSSGTGQPGSGPQGPGTIPFRSADGKMPQRGS